MRRALLVAALAGVLGAVGPASPPAAEELALYVEAAMVVPVEGEPIPDGRIVIRDGCVAEVGADVKRPPFSRLVDARTQWVTPGFVVPGTRLAMPQPSGSRSEDSLRVPIETGTKAADELYPLAEEYSFLLRHGITAVALLPGDDTAGLPGQASVISTRTGARKDMLIDEDAALVVQAAAHTAWRDAVGKVFEAAVEKADEGKRDEKRKGRSKAKEAKDGDKKPKESDDPVAKAVAGKLPILLLPRSTAGWTAARDVLPLDAEPGLKLAVWDAPDLWRLAHELAEAKATVVTWPALVRMPRTRIAVNRAREYAAAKVPYAFTLPADSMEGAAGLRDAVIEMVRTGCTREDALAAITSRPAALLGVDANVGSIRDGRHADLLFWSGDPFDPVQRLERVMVRGEFVEPAGGSGSVVSPAAATAASQSVAP